MLTGYGLQRNSVPEDSRGFAGLQGVCETEVALTLSNSAAAKTGEKPCHDPCDY